MEKETREKKVLQWHPAFYASIQIELAEEADKLLFENEHQLGTKPKEIDVLIIKKHSEVQIEKNIGRIFRGHNIVEYKSPKDYLSIDDFYKVYGYACFYKSDAGRVDAIKADDLTITFVCKKYPHKMVRHLKIVKQLQTEKIEDGIYYINGDTISMQLVITSELSLENNLWLANLTNELKETAIAERLVQEYGKHRSEKLYKSVMDIIVRANSEKFEEDSVMCEALEELMEKKIVEIEHKAELRGLEKGEIKGKIEGKEELIIDCLRRNKDCQKVSDFLGLPIDMIKEIEKKMMVHA